ncbi:MAG: MurR/RpiR family transcriptional regulator [Sporomusaceae bacterium]|nr:MurR/RpiR family transcriptional regulator [Sporomusaceae bacterium]
MEANDNELNGLLNRMLAIAGDSPTYEKLAHYIEKNYIRIIFMTAGELAAEIDISQGSVSRFCMALGYRGFNEFQRSLQKFVSKEITVPQRLQYIRQNQGDHKVRSILEMERENINELAAILCQPQYRQLIDKIVAAPEVVLLSARMSATLLPYTYYVLSKIRNGVSQVTPDQPAWETLNLRDPQKQLILVISFPRYPNVLVNKLRELRREGFTVAALTDSMISPVAGLADLVLYLPITISSIFDIYSTPLLFLNLLLRDVAKATAELEQRLSRFEKLDTENNVYYSNGGL